MKTLLTDLISTIDQLEAQKPKSLPWKPLLERIMKKVESKNLTHEKSTNPLFRALDDQNQILMALVLIGVIAGLSK